MKEFQDLLAVAMIGTSRAALPHHAGSPLSEHLNATQGDSEGKLLSRAALAGLVHFAGRRTDPSPHEPPPPAPLDTLREAPARFASHLPVVAGSPVINEWLRLCAQAGWRVPPSALPGLLDLARFDTVLRENLRPVLGERGVWLAQLNPDWRFNATTFSEESWLAATEAQKEGLFRNLRQKNPDASRELMIQHFKTEKAGTRKRLLNVLQETWADADTLLEPLLEDTLKDRSNDVQEQARALLQLLPESAYNARMTARVTDMLQQEKVGLIGKLMGKQKLMLHLPDMPDTEAARDGLETPDPQKKNATLDHFRALIRGTHPQALADALHLTPAHLLHLVRELGGADQLRAATLTTRHVPTANALQTYFAEDLALMQLSAPENITQRLHTYLKGQPDASPVLTLLDVLPAPWPLDLSEQLLNAIHTYVSRADRHHNDYRWESIMQNAAQHAHPQASRPASLLPTQENADYYTHSIREKYTQMLFTLEQRWRMHQDFREAQP